MTENTVPRVAKFADLRVGMTIERVYTHPSGSTVTHMGVASKVTERAASDDAGLGLATPSDDGNPRITLRILADPTPKPVPGWGTLVRVIGGKHDGKHAVALERDDAPYPWLVEDYGWVSAADITDWEVIHDPSAAKDDAADPLDENDHRDRLTADGRRIVWHGRGHWHTPAIHGRWCGHCRDNSFANCDAACGPLRFADEVTA